MRALDQNKDGVISAEEIAAAPKVLRALDKNGDGKLGTNELRPHRRRPPRGRMADGKQLPTAHSHASDEADKRILAVLARLDSERIGMMNVPTADGRLLRLLVEAIGAKRVVELGTSNGYSGLWMSLALRRTGGTLQTFDVDARRASLARANFKQAGIDGLITSVLGDAHEKVKAIKGPIDLVFIDADKDGYIDYLQKLLPLVRTGGLVVAHNMRRPPPDPRYIKAIVENPALETIFLHMRGAGIAVTLKKASAQLSRGSM